MLCAKETINGAILVVEIRKDNVFSKCSVCGKEVKVDISALISAGCLDLINVDIICKDCTMEKMGVNRKLTHSENSVFDTLGEER